MENGLGRYEVVVSGRSARDCRESARRGAAGRVRWIILGADYDLEMIADPARLIFHSYILSRVDENRRMASSTL